MYYLKYVFWCLFCHNIPETRLSKELAMYCLFIDGAKGLMMTYVSWSFICHNNFYIKIMCHCIFFKLYKDNLLFSLLVVYFCRKKRAFKIENLSNLTHEFLYDKKITIKIVCIKFDALSRQGVKLAKFGHAISILIK